ncbi:MAG: orotate phosphoribosyltransferase [Nanoarchaeota archaeon]|nr:orotate phosphoribosyltransferase [Nanoarchaeota archaeon]MBU1005441.1 orotate phosphoribosyltransferase [Nanoarchaeota archaeon]
MNEKVAKALCDAKVMKFGLFSLASGRKSPVYVDVRVLPSSPGPFAVAIEELSKKVKEMKIDVVAGAETAGIPIAAAIGLKAKLPMIYVRKRPKSYGTQSFIEGLLEKDQNVILIDDMITDGKSKMRFIDGIKETGAVCKDVLVILDREQGGTEGLSAEGVNLHSLITLKDLLEYMKEKELVDQDNYNITMNYLNNPEQWNK